MSHRTELETKLATFAAAQNPPLLVSYEGVPFTKPTSGLWLECYFLSGPTVTATVDASTNRERGMWVVNCWCDSGKGMGRLDTLVAQIVKLFPVLPKTGTVSIEQPGTSSRANVTQDGWICIQVSFPYRIESLA